MTPEPIKALAELRALSDAATPGPWRHSIGRFSLGALRSENPMRMFASVRGGNDSELGLVEDYPDVDFIVALVNAFRADPAALLSLVPRERLAAAIHDTGGFHLVGNYFAGNPDDCDMSVERERADDILAILNRDTGSAEPEPLDVGRLARAINPRAFGLLHQAKPDNPEWERGSRRKDAMTPTVEREPWEVDRLTRGRDLTDREIAEYLASRQTALRHATADVGTEIAEVLRDRLREAATLDRIAPDGLRQAAQNVSDRRTTLQDGWWISQKEMRALDAALEASPVDALGVVLDREDEALTAIRAIRAEVAGSALTWKTSREVCDYLLKFIDATLKDLIRSREPSL